MGAKFAGSSLTGALRRLYNIGDDATRKEWALTAELVPQGMFGSPSPLRAATRKQRQFSFLLEGNVREQPARR